MKNLFKVTALLGICAVSLGLSSCGSDDTIIIGTMAQPGQPILEHIKDEFEEKTDYKLEIQIFTDFATPNNALAAGEIDANLFQHAPFLETYNTNNNTTLETACIMYDCAYGAYSKKVKTVDAIPNGAKITIANDASNMKRCLDLLDVLGLIKVDYGTTASSDLNPNNVNDYITSNEKNLIISPISTSLIASSLNDQDVYLGIVNATFAIAANLGTTSNLLGKESDPTHKNANIVAIRSEDRDAEWKNTLVEILTSSETDTFVNDTFGSVITPYHG